MYQKPFEIFSIYEQELDLVDPLHGIRLLWPRRCGKCSSQPVGPKRPDLLCQHGGGCWRWRSSNREGKILIIIWHTPIMWFLAVHNSLIGDLVTHWVTHSLRTLLIVIQRATLETCDLWDIWSEWWEDMTWPKKLTKTNTKTKTFWEPLLRAILETCDIWDTDYNSDNWEPEKNWQRQRQRHFENTS